MERIPFSEIANLLAAFGVGWTEERFGMTTRLAKAALTAPHAYSAELAIQELLYRVACRWPLTAAARLIDGPLAPLVGLDFREDEAS